MMKNNKKYLSLLDDIKSPQEKPLSHRFNSKTLIIDGMNTFLRGFAVDNKFNTYGNHIGGVASFLKSVGYAIRNESPSRVIIVFDGEGSYINRRYLYPDYKKNRENLTGLTNKKAFTTKEDENNSKVNELERLVEYLECLPVTLMGLDKTEADDIIAFTSKYLYDENEENEVIIMSADRDFFQLVNNRICVYSPTKKIHYYEKEVINEFNCLPENYIIYKSFLGDDSDNIKGVHGIGKKNIHVLFPELFLSSSLSFEHIYEICEDPIKKSVLYERVINSKHILDINHRIMNLDTPDLSEEQIKIVTVDINKRPGNLRKYDFLKLWHIDGMQNSIPNVESWVNLFSVLNQ